jgi:anti-sigma regulatory factor (Ser/Thr protein kinase)
MEKKKKVFKVHGEKDLGNGNKIQIMFNSKLDRVKVRAVREGIVRKPYTNSDLFVDEDGRTYFVVAGGTEEAGVLLHAKLYLSDFKRVRES